LRTTLIIGGGGMLGSAFARALEGEGVRVAGRAELQAKGAAALVRDVAPELVLNCAAHTDVNAAERDVSEAHAVNAVLPGEIAAACEQVGAVIVHFSSTGCYGAWKDTPYSEADPPRPTTAHHCTKLAGEAAVRSSGAEHLIARLGWLYGGSIDNPKNFVWRRLWDASRSERLASDTSQRGCPTNVADAARQTLHAVRSGARGTVNLVTRGAASRFDYVSRIVAAADLPCRVQPVPAFARAAPVSPNETAVSASLQGLGLDIMPAWDVAVDAYVADLRASPVWNTLKEQRA
jgi:dTDP-4-dehydrorhamnose reductase